VAVPKRYINISVNELNLAKKYKLVLVSILKKITKKNIFGNDKNDLQVMGIVPPETILQRDDVLLLFGTPRDLDEFIEG
jgi:trk system potassium uptake protein TrkA